MYEACWNILALYSLKLRDKVDWHWPFCGDRQTVTGFGCVQIQNDEGSRRSSLQLEWYGRSHTSPHIIHNAMQLPLAVVLILILPCREWPSIPATTSMYSYLPPNFSKQRSSEQTTSRNNKPKPVAPPSRACRRMISFYCWLLFYAAGVTWKGGSWSSFVADDNDIHYQMLVHVYN